MSKHQRSTQYEPLLDRELPKRPWEKLGIDFFKLKGVTYLLVIDYFSKYAEVCRMKSTTASALIRILQSIFARFGYPDEIISDQGPPYDSKEFSEFTKQHDILHNPSSPQYARSNGQVERGVQTLKRSMTKAAETNET